MSHSKEIEKLKEILRGIEFVEYTDPEEGHIVWCPVCGETPEMKLVRGGFPPLYERVAGTGHSKKCELALAIYGDL